MSIEPKPYLIFPKLIEQPTWGGTYIASFKGWDTHASLVGKNIGQSFELYGASLLSPTCTDSSDPSFTSEEELKDTDAYLSLAKLEPKEATFTLGPSVYEEYKKMPVLIKFTQAKGNSFQLHAKPEMANDRWTPKAESWYFMEKGVMTLGINATTEVADYQRACHEIEEMMKFLSAQVVSRTISLEQAKTEARIFIQAKNPWQYVNVHQVEKDTLVDLSGGGLHHSWEDRPDLTPDGNIIYEVQEDVPDEKCTLRSFDQGKIKDDGTIRPITIDDYFSFLDPDPARNDVRNALLTPKGESLLKTKHYSMDLVTVTQKREESTGKSFVHLFVRHGKVTVRTTNGEVTVHKGHSCFVPHWARSYSIYPVDSESVLIKTYIES